MTDIFNEQQRDAREFFGTGEFAEDADTIREEREAAADNAEEIEADTIQVYLDNGYSLMEATAAAKGGNEWSTGDNTSTTVTSGDNRRTAEESQRKSSRNKNWINVSNLRTKNRKKPEEKIGGTLRYPYEALTDQTDYLQFDIKQYVPLGLKSLVRAPGDDKRYVKGGNDAAGGILPQELTTTTRAVINDGTILLPIPAQIQDSNSVSYGDSSLNGLQAAGVSAAAGMQESIAKAINEGSVKDAWNTFSGKIGNTAMEFGKNSKTGKSIFSSANTRATSFNSWFFDIDLSSKEPANCAWATRSTAHSVTDATPAQLIFGRDMLFDLSFRTKWKDIRTKRIDAIKKNNAAENAKRVQYKYKPGDQVLLDKGLEVQRKLYPKRTGPYKVIRIYPNGVLKIQKGFFTQRVSIRRCTPYRSPNT